MGMETLSVRLARTSLSIGTATKGIVVMQMRKQAIPRFSRLLAVFGCVLTLSVGVLAEEADSLLLPSESQGWTPSSELHVARTPTARGAVEIRGTGTLEFDTSQIQLLRSDVFQTEHFSVFDVLVHLADQGAIELGYQFDESADTYVIKTLNGLEGWWYDAHYAGGSFNRTVVRMDHYPVKDGMDILFYLEDPERLTAIHENFRQEVDRRQENGDQVIIPIVTIRSPQASLTFDEVVVKAHNVRADLFQPGVTTVLDVLLSLGEQEKLTSLTLTWRDRAEDADPIDNYFVNLITGDAFSPEATGSCIFTHQIGSETLKDYLAPNACEGSHIHLTADLEIIVSPEYVEWLWVCL